MGDVVLSPPTIEDFQAVRVGEVHDWYSSPFSAFGNRAVMTLDHYVRAVTSKSTVVMSVVLKSKRGGRELVGLASLYDLDSRNRTGWVAVSTLPRYQGSGLAIMGMARFIDRIFLDWDPFAIYFASSNFQPIETSRIGSVLELCGVHRARFNGKSGSVIDQHVYRIGSDRWAEQVRPLVSRRWGMAR